MRKLLVTIDGPAGAGKTTVSRMLADRLGYRYIDTGALYRAVAYEAGRLGIGQEDDRQLDDLCRRLDIKFVPDEKGQRLVVSGSDITEYIRTPEISMQASAISARPGVRACLLDLQREMGKEKGAIFEGRDMGTVVFPDADVKFFLDAEARVRAQRRYAELKSKIHAILDEIEKDMRQRDHNDSSRKLAPLKPAEDAVIVDSTGMGIEDVIEFMISYIRNRG